MIKEQWNVNFDEVRIESSPFLRCLQTAGQVAEELEINDVHVNYRVCETLWEGVEEFENANGLEGGIFGSLEVKKRNLQDML